MILGVYLKNRPKDKWSLTSVAQTLTVAQQHSSQIIIQAKEFGYDKAESIIQAFDSVFDIPKILQKVKPEKLLYN